MEARLKQQRRPELSDLDLIRRARLEDTSAYEFLVQRYISTIYGLCYGLIGARDEATAVSREVFVKAWKALGHFRDQSSFSTWICRIALNRSINFRKKHRHIKGAQLQEFDPAIKQSDAYRSLSSKGSLLRKMSLSEFQKAMNDALRPLSNKQRAIVTLYDVLKMPPSEIAGIMGGSEEAMASRRNAAHDHLRDQLSSLAPDSSDIDLEGLLSLKIYERPSEAQTAAWIDSTMQAVRAAHQRPSLLLFPDKSLGWMFAQPRYGIAALFILFLALHMLKPPIQTTPPSSIQDAPFKADLIDSLPTNEVSSLTIPGMIHDYTTVDAPAPSETP